MRAVGTLVLDKQKLLRDSNIQVVYVERSIQRGFVESFSKLASIIVATGGKPGAAAAAGRTKMTIGAGVGPTVYAALWKASTGEVILYGSHNDNGSQGGGLEITNGAKVAEWVETAVDSRHVDAGLWVKSNKYGVDIANLESDSGKKGFAEMVGDVTGSVLNYFNFME